MADGFISAMKTRQIWMEHGILKILKVLQIFYKEANNLMEILNASVRINNEQFI